MFLIHSLMKAADQITVLSEKYEVMTVSYRNKSSGPCCIIRVQINRTRQLSFEPQTDVAGFTDVYRHHRSAYAL